VALRSGRPIRPKGRQTVPPRDAIRLELPGGGGIGDPRTRDPQRVLDDVRDGFITAQQARRDYGVVIDVEGRLDLAATEHLRNGGERAADTPEFSTLPRSCGAIKSSCGPSGTMPVGFTWRWLP